MVGQMLGRTCCQTMPSVPVPEDARGGDVLLRQDALGDDAGQPGDDGRHRDADGHGHGEQRGPGHRHDQHRQQQQGGKGDEDVHGGRHGVVHPAAREGRGQADGHADGRAHHDRPEAHDEGDAGAHHELGEEIAAQPVGAQEVGKAGALQAAATGVVGVIRQPQQ